MIFKFATGNDSKPEFRLLVENYPPRKLVHFVASLAGNPLRPPPFKAFPIPRPSLPGHHIPVTSN
jgi:hypothetical protein